MYVKSLLHDVVYRGQLVDETGNKAKALFSATSISHETEMSSIKTRYENLLAATQVINYVFVSREAGSKMIISTFCHR